MPHVLSHVVTRVIPTLLQDSEPDDRPVTGAGQSSSSSSSSCDSEERVFRRNLDPEERRVREQFAQMIAPPSQAARGAGQGSRHGEQNRSAGPWPKQRKPRTGNGRGRDGHPGVSNRRLPRSQRSLQQPQQQAGAYRDVGEDSSTCRGQEGLVDEPGGKGNSGRGPSGHDGRTGECPAQGSRQQEQPLQDGGSLSSPTQGVQAEAEPSDQVQPPGQVRSWRRRGVRG